MRIGGVLYLGDILNGIIEHISHGHGVMNLRLVFYPEKHIGGSVILHSRYHFHHIAVFLYRNGFIALAIRQYDRCRI